MSDDWAAEKAESDALLEEGYWLELSGEEHPLISPLSERGSGTPGPTVPADPHLYEYRWTYEYPGPLCGRSGRAQRAHDDFCIRLWCPVVPGWRVTELMATVEHLRPAEHEEDLRAQLAKDWRDLAPMISTGAQVAGDVAGVPEIGSVARAIARSKVTSVPQTTSTRWFVTRVNTTHSGTRWRGTEWHLPIPLLDAAGQRISGHLLVAFREYRGEDPPRRTAPPGSDDVPEFWVECRPGLDGRPGTGKQIVSRLVVSPVLPAERRRSSRPPAAGARPTGATSAGRPPVAGNGSPPLQDDMAQAEARAPATAGHGDAGGAAGQRIRKAQPSR
jgi:hypothetical protein